MKIIIVDDDPDDRDVFCSAVIDVEPESECIELSSAHDLVAYLASTEKLPDYIFIDMQMPRVNGVECIVALRQQEKFDRIKLVMYSSLVSPPQKKQLDALKVKILEKTTSYKYLAGMVRNVLQENYS